MCITVTKMHKDVLAGLDEVEQLVHIVKDGLDGLDEVEQLGGEVGDDHVRSSSPHARCHLRITIKSTTIQTRE